MSYQDLALAIVEQAVEDYKECKAAGRYTGHIAKFFKSDWCRILLMNTPYDGNEILEVLESRVH